MKGLSRGMRMERSNSQVLFGNVLRNINSMNKSNTIYPTFILMRLTEPCIQVKGKCQ